MTSSTAATRYQPPRRPPGPPRVVHMTSVHKPDDPRIFAKECRTLAALGYDVHFIAPNAPGEVRSGVRLWGVAASPSAGRAVRMTRTVAQVLRAARALDADVYHLHDPELIPAGLLLSREGKRVIYDAHEDLLDDILVKPWIRPRLRAAASRVGAGALRWAARRFAAVVVATPTIQQRFAEYGCDATVLNNFPMLGEFDGVAGRAPKERAVCYVGGITELQGARVMVRAIADVDAVLLLAGELSPVELRDDLAASPGWGRVVEHGRVGRAELVDILARSKIGLCVYAPVPGYMLGQPTKVYEYMAAGLPVIASDFPLWRTIVEDNECGLCIDGTDPGVVARSIQWLLDHPEEAATMGRNGRRAAERRYSWEPEARKLGALYEAVLR
jgi:glycosyltransferase involved in cell wall biosynthesis